MNFRPLRDRVFIKPIPVEEMSKGGIIIPDNAKESSVDGVVVAVGTGIINRDGELVPLDVKVGDRVLYKRNGSTILEIEHEGEKYLLMSEFDVLAVIG